MMGRVKRNGLVPIGKVLGSAGVAVRMLLVGQIKEFSIAVPFQEAIESLHEAIERVRIVAVDR